MSIWRLIIKEIAYRKSTFAVGVLSVLIAVGCALGAVSLLRAHDLRTKRILADKEAKTREQLAELQDEIRKAMLKLGFNIVVLPRDQNLADWYADDFASKYMPEEYVERLSKSRLITVRHLLPSLQQKIVWPETKRTIILIGARGEAPDLHPNPKQPMVEPVERGTMVVGHEIHRSLGINVGHTVTLLGREFTVAKCHAPRGSKDDITVWIHLAEAQALLGREGQINAILAVECRCGWGDLARVRQDITRVLPGTQVIERVSRALARAEARREVEQQAKAELEREAAHRAQMRVERERLASLLVPVVVLACAIWIGLLAFANVRDRRSEIGILRALGFRSRQILTLFLGKAALLGAAGGALGCLVGLAGGLLMQRSLGTTAADAAGPTTLLDYGIVLLSLLAAPALAAAASWIPATLAVQQDPAEILRED